MYFIFFFLALVTASPVPASLVIRADQAAPPSLSIHNPGHFSHDPSDILDEQAFNEAVHFSLLKYGIDSSLPTGLMPPIRIPKRQTPSVASEGLFNSTLGDADQTFGNVTMGPVTSDGPPPVMFNALFDTGSRLLLVPGENCTGCGGQARYARTGVFQRTRTNTTYGTSSVNSTGLDYADDVTIAGLTAHSTIFTSLQQSTFAFGAIVGMGFSDPKQNSNRSTFFENLVKQNQVAAPEFSFFFSENSTDSRLTLGGRNESSYTGNFTALNVTQPAPNWLVDLDDMEVSGQMLGDSAKGKAVIDTGSSFAYLPRAIATEVFKRIGGSLVPSINTSPGRSDVYNVPCNTNASISLVFAGKPFEIAARDWVLASVPDAVKPADPVDPVGKRDAPLCRAAIVGVDHDTKTNQYVIGVPFLKNWYSTFSQGVDGGPPTVNLAAANRTMQL